MVTLPIALETSKCVIYVRNYTSDQTPNHNTVAVSPFLFLLVVIFASCHYFLLPFFLLPYLLWITKCFLICLVSNCGWDRRLIWNLSNVELSLERLPLWYHPDLALKQSESSSNFAPIRRTDRCSIAIPCILYTGNM